MFYEGLLSHKMSYSAPIDSVKSHFLTEKPERMSFSSNPQQVALVEKAP